MCQLVHAANANTRTLATRRAERLVLARRLGTALVGVTHGQSHPGRLDGKAGGLILLVGIALDELRYHTHGIARRALQAPTGHNAADEHCENVSPVPGK